METIQSVMDKVINNLQKIHVAGVTEQRLMINSIEVLEQIKGMITTNIVKEESRNEEAEGE